MKNKCLLIFIFLSITVFAEEPVEIETAPQEKRLTESFSYCRLGAFTIGAEVAIGHRFRSERFGWGPNINVAASIATLPSALLNFEVLYYPKSWNNGYWGLMPGIGVARISWTKSTQTTLSTVDGKIIDESFSHQSGRKWHLWAGLELIFGREFCKNGKRRFHQLSIGFPYIGYNYGWAF